MILISGVDLTMDPESNLALPCVLVYKIVLDHSCSLPKHLAVMAVDTLRKKSINLQYDPMGT